MCYRILCLAVASLACGLCAWASMASAASSNRPLTVTADGRIGPLRIGASGRPAVLALFGSPAVERNAVGSAGTESDALGYGCRSSSGLGAPLAPVGSGAGSSFCQTALYLKRESGHLGTFFTSSPRFRGPDGIQVGMPTARAARLLHRPPIVGCGSVIRISGPRGILSVVLSGTHPRQHGNKILAVGGRVGALVLHSSTDDVGVFDCF